MSLNTETKHTGLEVPYYTIVIKAIGEKMIHPVMALPLIPFSTNPYIEALCTHSQFERFSIQN